ncbi:MAG: insulinase family protein [Myxococcota bacterium]
MQESETDSVSVYVVYAVGSRMETPETSGLAHLTEHAMFAGTHEVGPGELERTVRELGGDANAYTRDDYTLYYDDGIPPAALARVLDLEADRMRNLSFPEKAVSAERSRLEVEERETASDTRRRRLLIDRFVFGPAGYGASVPDENGHTQARQIEIETIRAFYDRWYQPGRAAVVVAGDLPAGQALDAIERAFGAIPATNPVNRAFARATPSAGSIERTAKLSMPRVVRAWLGPARRTDEGSLLDRVALETLALVLDQRHTGLSVSAGQRQGRDRFTLSAAGADADALVEKALREATIAPMAASDLAAAQNLLERRLSSAPLRGRPYFSLAAQLGIHSALGDPTYLSDYPAVLRDLTPASVHEAAQRWLVPASGVAMRFVPDEGSQIADPTQLPDDSKALWAFAERALDSGDHATAAEAFTRFAAQSESRKQRVIALFYVGRLERELGRMERARAALEEALSIVDYPAVRAELEALDSASGAGDATSSVAAAPPPEPEVRRKGRGVANPETLDPEIVRLAETWMTRVERWRGLPFREDLRIEYGAPNTRDEKIAGYYSPREKRLVVMAGRSETFASGTLLHEIVHALQDQHFDLTQLHEAAASTDAARALSALVEGEAMLAVSELMNYDFLSHATLLPTSPVDRDRFGKVFRYGEGMRMVKALRAEGGWPLVNAAWNSPPNRTLEVLRPDLWLARQHGNASLAAAADGSESLGAYGVCLFLGDAEASRPEAREFARHLVQDHYQASEPGSGPGRWTLEFRDPSWATRFASLAREREGVSLLDSASTDARVVLELEAWRP